MGMACVARSPGSEALPAAAWRETCQVRLQDSSGRERHAAGDRLVALGQHHHQMKALPPWLRPSNSGTSVSLFVRLPLMPPPLAALSQYGMLGRGVPCVSIHRRPLPSHLTTVVTPPGRSSAAYVDGSGSGTGWVSDGFVKLGRCSSAVQKHLGSATRPIR